MYEISKKDFHDISCEEFDALFMTTLNIHAPMKVKYIRANNSPFMNSEQRNHCVAILRKIKIQFYEHLNPSLISDNKTFWKQVKPFFSDKTPRNSKILLSEGNEIISNPTTCAKIFNNFFSDAVDDLEIDRSLYID